MRLIPPPDTREISGFPFYLVSRSGAVYSCRSKGGMIVQWRPISPWKNPDGRIFASLRKGLRKAPYVFSIHRLVADAFIGPNPGGLELCHNDGNPKNNHASNLRWDTHVSNMADRNAHGTAPVGEGNPAAKLTAKEVSEIRAMLKQGHMQKDIAPEFGVSKQTIQAISSGKIWSHIKEERAA